MKIYTYPPLTVSVPPVVGGATEAKQDVQITLATSANTKLDSIITQETAQNTVLGTQADAAASSDTGTFSIVAFIKRGMQNWTSLLAKIPAVGQKASAASIPVVLSSEQEAEIGIVTEAAPASDTASSGLNGRLQRIAQRLTSLIALFPTSLGQKTMANSLAVTLASDQSSIPVTTSVTDMTATGTITAINQNVTMGAMNGIGTMGVQVVGTYTGALTAQITIDGTTWVATNVLNVTTGGLASAIVSTTQGILQVDVAGAQSARIIALGAVTGLATVTLRGTRIAGLIALDAPLPTGSNIIGALTANQSVNVAQMNGTATAMGAGNSSTGTQRVVIATDQTSVATTPGTVAGTITSAQVAVGTTAVRATVAGAAPSATRKKLQIKPNINNTGRVWIGPAAVTTASGLEIVGPDRLDYDFDAGDYYLISDTAAQSVDILEKV